MTFTEDVSWQIDQERPADVDSIRRVNLAAFEGPGEAAVVDQLRRVSPGFHSFVARAGNQVLGYILYTPAHIVQPNGLKVLGLGLAPLAVTPNYQGRGIGSALCRESLKRIAVQKPPFVIVLGHPEYYPRFGFKRASLFNIRCAYQDVPDDCFMIRIFDREKMAGVSGVAYYRPEFDSVS